MLVALAKPLGLGNTISAGHPPSRNVFLTGHASGPCKASWAWKHNFCWASPSRNLFLTGHASGPCKASWAWKHWAFVQMKLGTDHILALVWM